MFNWAKVNFCLQSTLRPFSLAVCCMFKLFKLSVRLSSNDYHLIALFFFKFFCFLLNIHLRKSFFCLLFHVFDILSFCFAVLFARWWWWWWCWYSIHNLEHQINKKRRADFDNWYIWICCSSKYHFQFVLDFNNNHLSGGFLKWFSVDLICFFKIFFYSTIQKHKTRSLRSN